MGLMHLWMSVTSSSSEIPTARSAGWGKKSSVMVNKVTKATWLQTECIRQPHEKALNYWWREVIPGSWKWRFQHMSSLYKIFQRSFSQLWQVTINPLEFASSWYPGHHFRILQEILQPFIRKNNLQSEHQPSHKFIFLKFSKLTFISGLLLL